MRKGYKKIKIPIGNKKTVNVSFYCTADVTRTRENAERGSDLINYGAVGAACFHSVDNMIQKFRYVQYIHGINSRKGRRMYHEVLNLKDCEFERLGRNPEILCRHGMLPGLFPDRASGGICCALGIGKALSHPFCGEHY